jgi:hypothetical protein
MLRDVTALLGDTSLTWTERRTRLQGWTGPDAVQADAVPAAQVIAAGMCAIGATAGAITGSPLLLTAFAATALVGVFAPNHPFEWLYNHAVASPRRLPPNRAAKRLACVMGVVFLGGSALAYAVGASTLGLVLALVFGGVAGFVAATGICVPSIVFVTFWGTTSGAAPTLAAAAVMARNPNNGAVGPSASELRPERPALR